MEARAVMWARILSDPAFSNTIVFVSERDGGISGFGSCGAQRTEELAAQGFDAEISAIYILQSAQRLGIGRSLMKAMAASLAQRGHEALSLWVLRDNNVARLFYEKLGGALVGEKRDKRPQGTMIEVAYGWRNVRDLAG
jgi:ribosomal protein S18 acetylase RimI-like enzyme